MADPKRCSAGRFTRRLAPPVLGLFLLGACAALAADAHQVTIAGSNVFPESITSTAKGDIIVSSTQTGAIYRAPAGSNTATLWIDPKVSGLNGALGVLADDRANVLYVCSHILGAAPEVAAKNAALLTFDLTTGAPMARYPMPDPETSLCNDIATAPNGTAYVAETIGGRVLRLPPGGLGLEVWAKDERLPGVDGLGVAADGSLYVNTVTTGKLFRIEIRPDGAAGAITEVRPSEPLSRPDGMRHVAINRYVLAESSGGRVSEVVMDGDRATVLPLAKGLTGVTSVTFTRGRVWYADSKFNYRRDPALKDKSPEPFTVESVEAAAR